MIIIGFELGNSIGKLDAEIFEGDGVLESILGQVEMAIGSAALIKVLETGRYEGESTSAVS